MKGCFTFAIMFAIFCAVQGKICSSTEELTATPFLRKYDNSYVASNRINAMVKNPVQDKLYFISYFTNNVSVNGYTGVVVTDFDLALERMVSIYGLPTRFDHDISDDGEYLYLLLKDTTHVVEFSTSTFTISQYLLISSVQANEEVIVKTVGSNIFITVKQTVGNVWAVCKWIRGNPNMACFDYGRDTRINYSPIDSSNIFINIMIPSDTKLYFISANYSDTSSLNWSKQIQCLTSCSLAPSRALTSRDGQSIYTCIFFSHRILVYKLNSTTGEPVFSGLKTFITSAVVYNLEELDSQIVVMAKDYDRSQIFIMLIKKDNFQDEISEYYQTGEYFYTSKAISSNGKELLVLGGEISSDYSFLRVPPQDLGVVDYMVQRSTIFTSISTTFDLRDPSTSLPTLNVTTLSITNQSSAGVAVNTETITELAGEYYVNIMNDDFNKSYLSEVVITQTLTLGCTNSADPVSLIHSVQELNGQSVPSWVSFDAATEVLTLNKTPVVNGTQLFQFAIQSQYGSDTYSKRVFITVESCSLDNCNECQADSPQTCTECKFGYNLKQGKCVKADAGAASTAAQAAAGVAMALAAASSVVSMSSPVGMFSMINQLQLYILLPMLPPYFPAKVGDFILGMDFAFVSLDFIPTDDIPLVKEIKKLVSYPQSDEYLNEIGISSGSSIVNYLPMVVIIVLIGFLHLITTLIYVCIREHKPGKCKKIIEKFFVFMTFNAYIRLIIQGFLFLMLSIVSEFKAFDTSRTITIVSLVMCFMFTFGLIIFSILAIAWYLSGWSSAPELYNHWSITELGSGLKNTKWAKMYSLVFLVVRLSYVLELVLLSNPDQPRDKSFGVSSLNTYYVEWSLFFITQFAFCVYMIWIRPFDGQANNLVECFNQICLTLVVVPLLFMCSEESWTESKEDIYIYALLAAPFFNSVICFCNLLLILCTKCKSSKKRVHTKLVKLKTKPTTIQKEESKFSNMPCQIKSQASCANLNHPNDSKMRRINS
ncbi:unnamed protein product [Moneuplotes crassus]|uniref:Uncharacterized protein n=1 Tax=Euplotes crassus TaxID=5936 RepID=A0AAD2D4E7_EUPCR|nr:unnamed protein product [Moneuplotes crassus]